MKVTQRWARAGGVAALVVLAAAARAEVYTGRELLLACTAPAAAEDAQRCQGWIDWGFSSPHFCLPADVDDSALRAHLVGWLEAHPGKLHMPGGALVQNALYDAWPCPRQR